MATSARVHTRRGLWFLVPALTLCLASLSASAPAATYTQLTTDTGEDPTWSRDGTDRIVYTDDYHIYVIPASGGPRTEITHDYAGWIAWYPSWSPNGSQIAFWSVRIGVLVCPASADGDTAAVVIGGGGARDAHWSPDGSAFATAGYGGDPGDYPHVDGIHVFPAVPGGYDSPTRIEFLGGQSAGPCWSPGGTLIAFRNSAAGSNIFVVPSDGSAAPAQLTFLSGWGCYDPDWSADGQWIVFTYQQSQWDDPKLWIVPAAGGAPFPVIPDAGHPQTQPAWSADGSRIVYTGPGGIWVASDIGIPSSITEASWSWGRIKALFGIRS